MIFKIIATTIGTLLTLGSAYVYYRDMFLGLTKPHIFTWLIWTILTGIAFAGQLAGGGGLGSWVMGVTALTSVGVLVFAFFRGEKEIVLIDWISLAAALIALGLWIITKRPLEAVILVTITDVVAYIPTIRKSYFKPYQETLSAYLLAFFKFGITLFALEQYSLVTWLYPAALALMSFVVVAVLFWGRKRKTPRSG